VVWAKVLKGAGAFASRLAARFAKPSNVVDDVLAPLGRGSTGRITPNSLTEQLAMDQAMSNPAAGTRLPINMVKPWPMSDGWVKMAQNVNGVEIHYVRNVITGAVDDFKFIGGIP
jgi:hypothetical protein